MVALIVVAFAVLLPFASKNPDGLQKLVADSGTKIEQEWNGLMSGYSIASVGNGYVSAFLAGLFGIVAVLLATFLLGKAVAPKKKGEAIKQI
jgi:hypothetical protein